MKSSVIILSLCLSLLDITASAPLPLDQDLRITPLSDRTYDVINPAIIPPQQPTASSPHGTLVRRARRRKTPKDPATKQADAKKVLKDNNPQASKAAKGKEVANKQAEVSTKKTTVQTKTNEKTTIDAQLTPKQKADRDAAMAEEKRKKEEEEKNKPAGNVVVKINPIPEADIRTFWNEFSAPKKGKDGLGLVKKADIAAAFRRCVPANSFLFWSANRDPGFETGAVSTYQFLTKKMKIAKAVKRPACTTAGLTDMKRPTMINSFDTWIEQNEKAEHIKKHPQDKNKVFKFSWRPSVKYLSHGKLNYDYYWAAMSAGYAAGAHGEVHYLRPDRAAGETGDYPGTHWVNYELPELVKNKAVKVVKEFTMASTGGDHDSYKNARITPNSMRIRVQH